MKKLLLPIFCLSYTLLFFTLPSPLECKESLSPSSPYTVTYQGIQNPEILQALKENSLLLSLKDRPPASPSALKRRIENERNRLIKTLHSFALYSAKITYTIDSTTPIQEICFLIEPGPVYHFASIQILPEIHYNNHPKPFEIIPGEPAYPKKILEAEESLLLSLSCAGYPYAQIKERTVTADQKKKEINVLFHIETGPQAFFGKTLILGNTTVKDRAIRQHLSWKEGDLFNPQKINDSILSLESTGLFRAVSITYPEEPPSSDDPVLLPMTITLKETKQRSLALGLLYSTQRGPGFTVEWEHRNYSGIGDKFSFDANILQQEQEAKLEYVIPRFLAPNQDLIWAVEAKHDDTEGFEESWVSLSGILERKLSRDSSLSYGMMYKQLHVTGSDHDGDFSLLKTPIQWRWSNANDLLDPIYGNILYLKMEPTLQLSKKPFGYLISNLTGSSYFPIYRDRFVIAAKVQLGSILGASEKTIPPSELFYAGSETTLRGYGYYTVSPLDKKGDPVGGRSLMVSSLEARWRATEKWGGALFYDIGNVYRDSFPNFQGKMRQSVGVGLRYYTPVGPLRFDVAFPLNRRKHLDPRFQFYFSVGQSF